MSTIGKARMTGSCAVTLKQKKAEDGVMEV